MKSEERCFEGIVSGGNLVLLWRHKGVVGIWCYCVEVTGSGGNLVLLCRSNREWWEFSAIV